MARLTRPAVRTILRSIDRIEEETKNLTFETYASDWRLQYIIERAIEVISEASRRLPVHLREQHPQVAWKQVMGIGNVLRHDYDEIAAEIVFDAAVNHLPTLKAAVLAIDAGLDEPEE